MNDPIISKNGGHRRADPEVALAIPIYHNGSIKAHRSRALVGWDHQNDTAEGRRTGKLWCWVSDGNHFQVYDEHFNRSRIAKEVRFCGVANFTMVRMFHPYWAKANGEAPRDMNPSDKNYCRRKYRQLMRRHNQAQGHVATGQSSDDDDSGNDEIRRKRRRAPKRSTGRRRNGPRARHRRNPSPPRDSESSRPSSSENDRWAVPDGTDDSSSDSSVPLANRKRPKPMPDTDDEESDTDVNSGGTRQEILPDSLEGTATYGDVTVEALPRLGSLKREDWVFRTGGEGLRFDDPITILDDEENDQKVEEHDNTAEENNNNLEENEKTVNENDISLDENDKTVNENGTTMEENDETMAEGDKTVEVEKADEFVLI